MRRSNLFQDLAINIDSGYNTRNTNNNHIKKLLKIGYEIPKYSCTLLLAKGIERGTLRFYDDDDDGGEVEFSVTIYPSDKLKLIYNNNNNNNNTQEINGKSTSITLILNGKTIFHNDTNNIYMLESSSSSNSSTSNSSSSRSFLATNIICG